jgi:hypothetical protein
MVADINAEAAASRRRTGSQVLGVPAILRQHPFERPARSKRSPAAATGWRPSPKGVFRPGFPSYAVAFRAPAGQHRALCR